MVYTWKNSTLTPDQNESNSTHGTVDKFFALQHVSDVGIFTLVFMTHNSSKNESDLN